jgi:hypothetical protein
MQESPGADPTAEAAGSGRGRRRIALAAARHGQARWLAKRDAPKFEFSRASVVSFR